MKAFNFEIRPIWHSGQHPFLVPTPNDFHFSKIKCSFLLLCMKEQIKVLNCWVCSLIC